MACFSFSALTRLLQQRVAQHRCLVVRAALGLTVVVLSHTHALALTTEQARALTLGDTDARVSALQKALASPDAQTAIFLQAMADDAVKVNGTQVLIVRDGKAIDPVSGEAPALPDNAEDVINNNRMRGEIDAALSACLLYTSPSPRDRSVSRMPSSA